MAQGTLFGEYAPTDIEIVGELAGRAYAELPFGMGHDDRADLFAGFRNFVSMCDEPGGDQLVHAVSFTVRPDNGIYYLNYRRPGEVNPNEPDRPPGADHKYVFHYGSQTIARATEALGGALPAEMRSFLGICDDYYEEGCKTARIGAGALALDGVMFGAERDQLVHHLRLIDYVASPDDTLGEAHFDRSVATLALDESDSGLRGVAGQNGFLDPVTPEYIESLRDGLRPVSHFERVAKFFLAAGINHLPPHVRAKAADLPLLGHDITNDRPGKPRQAVVMFLNPHNRYPGYTVPDASRETGFDGIIEAARRNAA